MREFDPGRFNRNQQPDTFVEAAYSADEYTASVFARLQPNTFFPTQRREPEVRFDLLPGALPGGLVERGQTSFVRLSEDASSLGSALRSERYDAFYGLERPWAATPWLTLTPVAGSRFTHYFTATDGRDDYSRALGELGGDLRARISGTFNVKNSTWGIDGLRHLIEPFVQYRWIPEADKGQAYIPAIDRTVFSTRLQPLDLGDARNLDQLSPTDTLRLGLDQRLQTRDEHGGSRDLVTLTLAQDIRSDRLPGQTRASDLQGDFALYPAPWLGFSTFARWDPHTDRIEECNTAVSLTDSQDWTVALGTQFLRGNLEEYTASARLRLNERYALTGRWNFDARTHTLYDQTYGVRQVFRNLWAAEYQVSWTQGQRHENGFTFRVLIDLYTF